MRPSGRSQQATPNSKAAGKSSPVGKSRLSPNQTSTRRAVSSKYDHKFFSLAHIWRNHRFRDGWNVLARMGPGASCAQSRVGGVVRLPRDLDCFRVAIVWAAIRLRRRSGFKYSDLRQGDARQQAETRKMLRAWVWITLAQTVAVGLGVLCCVQTKRLDLIGPVIGLVVSLHFAPLGRIFHVRAYYVTALVGSGISLAAFILPTGSHPHELYCSAMTLVMWASAVYVIRNANRIARRATQEAWAA